MRFFNYKGGVKKSRKVLEAEKFCTFFERRKVVQNKQTLLNLVDRAERGVLLPGEAQILREAIEMLDDMCMCVDSVMTRDTAQEVHRGYDSSTTQTFRVDNLRAHLECEIPEYRCRDCE